MDKTLDEIISTRPRGARRGSSRRGNAKAQVLGSPVSGPATRARAAAASNSSKATTGTASAQPADKIIVSNLPFDVNESQIKELFHSTVGPLREVTLHYDAKGVSKGVAAVHFQRKGDGNKAYQQYNNRLIDGSFQRSAERPMKIEIVVDPTRGAPAASLASRVAPPPATAETAAPRGGRPRRGGRGGGGRKRNERPAKSAADLDAEMEDYTASNAPAAPAPAT